MLPAVLAERRKEAAELALYRAGRCCQAKCGAICRSLGVQLERNEKLRAAGMGRSGARALCRVCEWSSAWADIELTRQTLADQGSKVEVWLVVKAVLEEAKSETRRTGAQRKSGSKGSPSINVRIPEPELERLKAHADRHFAGNVSVMVKVALAELLARAA
jgi:predicted DNA binding CopG/RHH family protein